MSAVIDALAKAFGQLSDRAVLGVLLKSVLVTLMVFAGLGVGVYFSLIWLGASFSQGSSGMAEAAAAAILTGIAFWLLFRVVALAVLQFFADEVVAAVEARHYPARAQQARPLPFRRDLANSLRGVGRTLGVNLLALPVAIILLITGIGPAIVFLAVNAWLLGRELTDMAWFRHEHEDGSEEGAVVGPVENAEPEGTGRKPNPVPRLQRVMLGGVIAGLMVVPFANLLAPIVGAAAGTHLTHRHMPSGKAQRR